ncbi:TIR domain-containing protein [Paenibacillus elgii]|uniref:TIR domain-containing protein n=1 Tax=Paenibacillus elgii TaxID=189691 RepID=UPI000248CE38|nr:TIR domain-containing protein [Paenibacillus elgii]
MGPFVEEVFKDSGVPKYTFVEPNEFTKLVVYLRTKGKGLVVEGPSGIGKTSGIKKAIEKLQLEDTVLELTARDPEHLKRIENIPNEGFRGIVIVDDFHRLEDHIKEALADYMKILADRDDEKTKMVIVGINKAGDSLIKFANDLNNRIDTIRFKPALPEQIFKLITNGETVLNLEIDTKDEISVAAQGSFHIAQILCKELCLQAGVSEKVEDTKRLSVSLELIKQNVYENLDRTFAETARIFATGPKIRRGGRAPYLHILNWVSKNSEWTLELDLAIRANPKHRSSVGQVVDKGNLYKFYTKKKQILEKVIHFDPNSNIIGIEDPKFLFYLRNMDWNNFARKIGYPNITFSTMYDIALSFAGEERDIANQLFKKLSSEEISVFYDKNEQHRILAEDVEEYLGPIYRSEARFILVLLSKNYPRKIWTKYESEQFKERFNGEVIPVWFSDALPGMFDKTSAFGGITIDVSKKIEVQVSNIVEDIVKKLSEVRIQDRIKGIS